MWIAAVVVLVGTFAFQYFFARRANGVAFRRVMHEFSLQQFVARERIWAMVSIPAGMVLLSWWIYFDLVLSRTIQR